MIYCTTSIYVLKRIEVVCTANVQQYGIKPFAHITSYRIIAMLNIKRVINVHTHDFNNYLSVGVQNSDGQEENL